MVGPGVIACLELCSLEGLRHRGRQAEVQGLAGDEALDHGLDAPCRALRHRAFALDGRQLARVHQPTRRHLAQNTGRARHCGRGLQRLVGVGGRIAGADVRGRRQLALLRGCRCEQGRGRRLEGLAWGVSTRRGRGCLELKLRGLLVDGGGRLAWLRSGRLEVGHRGPRGVD